MHNFSARRFATVFIALSIPLFLVFLGMRVPNLSRPHRPRPLNRAVIQAQTSSFEIEASSNISIDPVIYDNYFLTARLPASSHLNIVTASAHPPHLTFWSIASRAPPSSIFFVKLFLFQMCCGVMKCPAIFQGKAFP
jgi:hypothetical protein